METLVKEKATLKNAENTPSSEVDNEVICYQPGDECMASQEGHEHVDPNDWDRKILICTHNGSGGYYWRDSGRRRSG